MRGAISMFVVVAVALGASLAHANDGSLWGDKAPFTRTACSFEDFYAGSLLYAKPESKYWYHLSIIDESSRGFFSKEYQYIVTIMRRKTGDQRYKTETVSTVSFKRKTDNKYIMISSKDLPMPNLGSAIMLVKEKLYGRGTWFIRTARDEPTSYRCAA